MIIAATVLSLLLQQAPPADVPMPHSIELAPAAGEEAAQRVLTLPRDERLRLNVTLTVPSLDVEVDELDIKAVNESPGDSPNRRAPNLFITAERIEADGARKSARTRIVSSGGGQSLNEYHRSIDLDLLDTPEARKERIQRFFARALGPNSAEPAGFEGAAAAYFDPMYIANPVGTYEVTITYRPQKGWSAGKTFTRRLTVVVSDGPDTIDRLPK